MQAFELYLKQKAEAEKNDDKNRLRQYYKMLEETQGDFESKFVELDKLAQSYLAEFVKTKKYVDDKATVDVAMAEYNATKKHVADGFARLTSADNLQREAIVTRLQMEVQWLLVALHGDRESTRDIKKLGLLNFFGGATLDKLPLLREWANRVKRLWKKNHTTDAASWSQTGDIGTQIDNSAFLSAVGWKVE